MRPRPLESIDELHALLEEQGVAGAPREGPSPEALQGLLALALHLAERHKAIGFEGFSWSDPRFVASDAKWVVDVLHARLDDPSARGVAEALDAALARPHGPRVIVALDARPSAIKEYELVHHLYGEVTLHAHRVRPRASADARIEEARAAGWTETLKEHNLLPGRGLVVPDDKHGLFLTDPLLEECVGALVLLAPGQVGLYLNPFARREVNEAAWQDWLKWGRGTVGASEWRTLLDVRERKDDEDD